jgi:hypothetical protein
MDYVPLTESEENFLDNLPTIVRNVVEYATVEQNDVSIANQFWTELDIILPDRKKKWKNHIKFIVDDVKRHLTGDDLLYPDLTFADDMVAALDGILRVAPQ